MGLEGPVIPSEEVLGGVGTGRSVHLRWIGDSFASASGLAWVVMSKEKQDWADPHINSWSLYKIL